MRQYRKCPQYPQPETVFAHMYIAVFPDSIREQDKEI